MSIEWIEVGLRVPDDRRKVLSWGPDGFSIGGYQPQRSRFLGPTRFNATRNGGQFDIERYQRFTFCRVTHWAEIEGPDDKSSEKK